MEKNNDSLAFIIGVVLVVITGIVCATYYNIKRDDNLKSNIESAIVKGIDPVAVRCAYETSSNTCVVYAANHNREFQPKK
jgi:hypothetical protein